MSSIIIIGGGPSGMMAAIAAKTKYPKATVIILERNKILGMKMKLTGGGRCNVTARMPVDEVVECIPKNGKFLYSALSNFGPEDIIHFFKSNDCPLKMEDHMRMFPKSDKAQDIVTTLMSKLESLQVKVYYEQYVEDIVPDQRVVVTKQARFSYDHLVIATGGITLPQSGSDGTGHKLAQILGHRVTDLVPAEVPLVSNDFSIQSKLLQGLSFKDVAIKVYDKQKLKKVITHDLLITHFGLSGPAALRASFYVLDIIHKTKEPVLVKVDFIPKVKISDLLKLKTTEQEMFLKNEGLPKRLLDYLKDQALGIEKLKDFEIIIYATRGWSQAFVTNGGISVKEIDPKTLKSKIDDHVSFCGEVLDVNAFTGGFNITLAFATGYAAGSHIDL